MEERSSNHLLKSILSCLSFEAEGREKLLTKASEIRDGY